MRNPTKRCPHHLRTQSLAFHSLPAGAARIYRIYPSHLLNVAGYALNVETKQEEDEPWFEPRPAKPQLTARPCTSRD